MEHFGPGVGVHLVLKSSWSKEFSTRRPFDKSSENQPYVDYIQPPFHAIELSSQGAGSPGDDESYDLGVYEEDEESENESENETDPVDDIDVGDGETVQAHNTVIENGNVVEAFMEGDDQTLLPFFDQVEVVATFCKEAKLEELSLGNPGAEAKSLLYEDPAQSLKLRQRKKPYEQITPHQLYEQLKKEVREYDQ